jgi:LysM repeat protein
MNDTNQNPSPLVPQGSLLDNKQKSRARVRIAVCVFLSVNIVFLMALLIAGCRPGESAKSSSDLGAGASLTTDQSSNNAVADTATTSNSLATGSSNTLGTAAAPGSGTGPASQSQAMVPQMPMPAPQVGEAQDYTILKGDTFSSLHKKFGVKVSDLLAANPGVDPKTLKPGQKVHIPAPAPAAASASSAAMANTSGAPTDASAVQSGSGTLYTVVSGDNLTKIANHFGVSVRALRAQNRQLASSDRIRVGEKLKIPVKASRTPAATEPAPAPAPQPAAASPTTTAAVMPSVTAATLASH